MSRLRKAALAAIYGGVTVLLPLTTNIVLGPTADAASKQFFNCSGHTQAWCQQSKRTVTREGHSTSAIRWPAIGCTSPPESLACSRGFYYW